MSTLHIFDFDDTLVSSEAKVRITMSNGKIKELSSEEYASYTPKENEIQDFSDFDAYPQNPEIIEPVFAELQSAIALDGIQNVIILTARSNPIPVRLFLRANRIPEIQVIAVGSADPMAKASYILNRVKNEPIKEVRVFEDNARNIRTIRKVMKKTGIKLKTNRVRNGKIE